jgi:phospholipid/cholesterol/gamma-HCH transport system substrate-binding protein
MPHLSGQFRHQSLRLETGAFVLLGCFAFWFLITQIAHRSAAATYRSHYDVTATFDNVGSLRGGARVSISGVEVGRVAAITFDSHLYKATVLLRMSGQFTQIPKDSEARIVTQGILGGQSIALIAGGDSAYLDDGATIPHTQSAFVLEKSIGRLVARFISRSERAGPKPEF